MAVFRHFALSTDLLAERLPPFRLKHASLDRDAFGHR
jgi:hypothetical protein